MRFMQTEEQLALAEAVDDITAGMGGTQVARDWGAGDLDSGRALWAQFSELGLAGLVVSEAEGGMGGGLTDLTAVFERLGYNAAPGPYVESVALLPRLLEGADREALLGGAIATAEVTDLQPFALDAAAADLVFVVSGDRIARGAPGEPLESMSAMRRVARVSAAAASTEVDPGALSRALNAASLANSSMLLGVGERLLAEAVGYAKVREQFGRQIGEFQAIKHQLADVRVALSFARPLVWSAALSVEEGAEVADRDVSVAKLRAAAAAELAAAVSLQVHGAIGYTLEHDLSLWLNWVPALVASWGTCAEHRDRLAAALLAPASPLGETSGV